jgi:ribosomal protein S18 acetylase RimI-like enzyme
MKIAIKEMETDDEINGKAYVHWKSWQEAYKGIVNQEYLDKLTLDKCVEISYKVPDNTLIAKLGDSVIGFSVYGKCRDIDSYHIGEVMAIYVLSEYYSSGVGFQLMSESLKKLNDYNKVIVWVLKDNERAIGFYEKFGFKFDGKEKTLKLVTDIVERRMILDL